LVWGEEFVARVSFVSDFGLDDHEVLKKLQAVLLDV
jgi:hypothetical protein